jgi:hypothetical protein
MTVERFRLVQDGMVVAAAEGPDAFREIAHYAFVYGQDGPVFIQEKRAGKWREWGVKP